MGNGGELVSPWVTLKQQVSRDFNSHEVIRLIRLNDDRWVEDGQRRLVVKGRQEHVQVVSIELIPHLRYHNEKVRSYP